MREPVYITEVGPRDGLQNEHAAPSTAAKIAFIEALVAAGSRQIEVTSFVHPRWVPAMADASDVFAGLRKVPGVRYLALVPNMRGYDRAVDAGCDAIAIFTAASEGFAKKNINMTIRESLDAFAPVAARAASDGIAVRGYVSTVFACPYDGRTAPAQVVDVTHALRDLGCYEVSLGDTIGVGTPTDVGRLLDSLLTQLPADELVMHFHDTWGMGAANVAASLPYGIRRFDSSAGGLGGCPYARSASGNVATEDLVYLLEGLGYATGMDLAAVVSAADHITGFLDRPLPSRVHHAFRRVEAHADE